MRIAVSTTVVMLRVKREGTWGHCGSGGLASSVAQATTLHRSAPSSRALALTAAEVRVITGALEHPGAGETTGPAEAPGDGSAFPPGWRARARGPRRRAGRAA